jgi:hypothetical protein
MELRPTPTGGTAVILEAGVLLPSSVLHTGWFHALAVFVAINTLFYAALGLAKLFPKRRE